VALWEPALTNEQDSKTI